VALPRSLEPALTLWLFRHGCSGTQEILGFKQDDLKYEPQIRKKKFITLSAFFVDLSKQNLQAQLAQWLVEHAPATKVEWIIKENQDWLKEWKKHFKPFVHSGISFLPVWYERKKNAVLARHKRSGLKTPQIVIEPGMAFGTGTHVTTRFAIQLLKNLQLEKTLQRKNVLDVGAGSGILSVVAEKLGATKILAIDNDPDSWRECGKMFTLNKTKKCSVSRKQLSELKKPFDVVVANIIDGVLIDLKDDLWRITNKNGFLILSGVLTAGASAFITSFMSAHKGEVTKTLSEKEWTAFLIKVKK